MEEIWKDVTWIDGFEGLYKISSFGRVLSKNYRHTQTEHIVQPSINKYGYFAIMLHANGKLKNVLVHRLVATAFIENPDNFPLVNHKDENKLNNNVENLEWCTQEYNLNYSLDRRNRKNKRTKVSEKRKNTKHQVPHKYFCQVVQRDLDGKILGKHNNVSEVARIKEYDLKSLIDCCKGKRKTAYGYKWEFAD